MQFKQLHLQCHLLILRPSLKKSLFEIATWGLLDPGGREGIYFMFFKLEVLLIKNWGKIKIFMCKKVI